MASKLPADTVAAAGSSANDSSAVASTGASRAGRGCSSRQAQSAEPSTADKTEDSAAEEESTDPFEKQLIDLLRQGKKIPAIKLYREQKGTGLKFSKEAVEALAAKHGIAKTGCASVLLVALFFVVVLVVLPIP